MAPAAHLDRACGDALPDRRVDRGLLVTRGNQPKLELQIHGAIAMPLSTFDQALASVDAGQRLSLLLGNGFSRAWCDDIFNYSNLLDRADFGDRDASMRRLFERVDTFDFEAVMRALESAATVLETYGGQEALLGQVRQDQERLKAALISAISRTHPARPHDVQPAQFEAARRFLVHFGQIFTVNYDLLFYWARNQDNLPPEGYFTDDGFRDHQIWREYDTNQQVHFLHGGLHIYEDSSRVRKLAHARAEEAIIDQVNANLALGIFPLFVAEPTAKKKRVRIERNPYLHHCFRALRDLEGVLFVAGHSMDANDRHIFDQIKASGISKVWVSIHGDEHSESNTTARANARAFLETNRRDVEFFDAGTAAIWG